jgi:hypothetical protein
MGREAGAGAYGIDPQDDAVVSAVVLPTLAEVCDRPDAVKCLPPSALVALIAEAAGVEARLAGALAVALHANGCTTTATPEASRLISVSEAAQIMQVTKKWFYARAGNSRFKFVKRLSAKNIRVDKLAMAAWLATR